jgi:hypothetical protein
MRPLREIERRIEAVPSNLGPRAASAEVLRLAEEAIENWILAKSIKRTRGSAEGFRLLALQRQGAQGDPSFNACRETCRELAYHYNLLMLEPDHPDVAKRMVMMRMLASHICLFISGKMENAKLGEFCCSSRALRLDDDLRA